MRTNLSWAAGWLRFFRALRAAAGCLFFLPLLLLPDGVAAQKFRPDEYGYVAGRQFQKEIAARRYELVSAFDTIDPGLPMVRATVLRNDTLKFIDLDLNEYRYEEVSRLRGTIRFDSLKKIADFHHFDLSGNYKTVERNGKKGMVLAATGRKVIEERYDGLLPVNNGYFYYLEGSRWGVLDSTGKVIVPAAYNNIISMGKKPFQVDYFMVQDSLADCNNYLIDMKSRKLTRPQYTTVGPFAFGELFGGCTVRGGKPCYLLLDKHGNELDGRCFDGWGTYPPFQWILLKDRTEGELLYSIADKDGKIVRENMSYLECVDNVSGEKKEFMTVQFRGSSKRGALDRNAQLRIPAVYNSIAYEPAEHVFVVMQLDSAVRFGMLDSSNRVLVPLNYTDIRRLGPDLFLLRSKDSGYFYRPGAGGPTVIPYRIGTLGRIDNGLVPVYDAAGKAGLLNSRCKLVLPFQYSLVANSGSYYYTDGGIFRKDGRMVIERPWQPATSHFDTGLPVLNGVFSFDWTREKVLMIDRYGNKKELRPETRFHW